ncbi:la-related protein 6B-like [Impatiens glandulifera]|uniref:la-related protein 6B-like n=1 Tax=Impatiens glandulifera TaxID=253017 RepID=UPI001FB0879C|nr:la-related protein 6B-like [Impatiens glandulifera]
MAQEANSLSETLDSSLSISADRTHAADHNQQPDSSSLSTDPSLSRSGSSSRLNAKAPEFVPRTSSSSLHALSRPDLIQPRAVIHSPQLSPPGLVHVYPGPSSSFRGQGYDVAVPNHFPLQNHRPHGHHIPMQYHHHHHHRPQFYSGGGFVDHREGSVQSPQQQTPVELDSSSTDKNSISEETIQKLVNQVDYYFSDLNLATTEHLMRFINKDPEGYVPISIVASFKKIKALVYSNSQLADILRNSTKLLVSEDGKKVKRQQPLTEADMEELQSRIVVAENLPEDHCHQNLMKIFSTVGSVKNIRTCQPQASNSVASPASRSAKADTLYSNKLHAFVEYESIEHAEKAVTVLTEEAKWRSGLRVRLMLRNTTKPMQTRVKKFGNETDPNCDENDTSTSEQIQTNGKDVVDDPSQHSDSRSNELTGEEIPNEKDGQRKGRNRNKGKGGRGRGQHQQQHQNNRGNQQAGPYSNNSEQQSTAIIGKQPPPGPRMPDGTRGFSMGRGKPVAVNNIA